MIKGIGELFQNLVNKYGNPKNTLDCLKEKYLYKVGSSEKDDKEDTGASPLCKTIHDKDNYEEMFFSYDEENNEKIIDNLLLTYKETKKELLKVCKDKEDSEAYEKLIEQYEEKMNKLQKKEIWNKPEKLAGNIIKIITQTVIKSWARKDTQNILRSYFKINGFGVVDFKKNHKITDDDLNYLNETLFSVDKEETDDESKDYKVIEMIQPIIKIAYDDDGEKEYKYLPGRCRFYLYSRKGEKSV